MRIAIVGSGNVAHVLGLNLIQAGHDIDCVLARNTIEGNHLANQLKANYTTIETPIDPKVELVILCISDDYIETVSSKINISNQETIVVHTSGSVGIDKMDKKHTKRGVFYPLQTIRKSSYISFKETPICINAKDQNTLKTLHAIAATISRKIFILTDEERKKVHLAAVVINNFTNHLVSSAYKYLEYEQIPIAVIQPLLQETLVKLLKAKPDTTQTGPAVRNDQETIKTHLRMLEDSPLKELYESLTHSIQIKHRKT